MYKLSDNNYPQVTQYINQSLKNVTISIYPLNNIPAVEMINRGKLEGWCWQSTTFLSVLFNDSDIVSRGDLILPTYSRGDYPHSWLELTYNGEEYVFDPTLNDLRKKTDYYKEFNARLKSQIKAERIRTALIDLANSSQEKPIYIPGTDYNIEDPFFRTNSRVTVEIESNKVKALNARFYSNG